jgi:hypothetical protein
VGFTSTFFPDVDLGTNKKYFFPTTKKIMTFLRPSRSLVTILTELHGFIFVEEVSVFKSLRITGKVTQ